MAQKEYRIKTLPAATAVDAIDWTSIPVADVDTYLWEEGYTPTTTAQMVYVEDHGFVLRMSCREANPLVTYHNYNDPVYLDSCMEFFADWLCDGRYINMEMNAAGTLLSNVGNGRHGRTSIANLTDGAIVKAEAPLITTQCIRVPVTNGHTAAVFVKFENKPTKEEILEAWANFKGLPQELELPHAPEQFITYFEEDNRPQAALDRDIYGGMGVTIGRLREDSYFDYKFVGLSHNTLRGAAGGAVLIAELLYRQGYFD